MVKFEFASGPKKPWLLATQRTISQQYLPDGILLLELDGAMMKDLEGLYRQITTVLKFPDYFGENFNALDDCITDLEWLPANGYLLVVKNAACLLCKETDDVLEGFISILNDAGNTWATPIVEGADWDRKEVPFHTILTLSERETQTFQKRIRGADIEVVRLKDGPDLR